MASAGYPDNTKDGNKLNFDVLYEESTDPDDTDHSDASLGPDSGNEEIESKDSQTPEGCEKARVVPNAVSVTVKQEVVENFELERLNTTTENVVTSNNSGNKTVTDKGNGFLCKFCDKNFKSSATLKVHFNRCKYGQNCEYCNKRFACAKDLEVHLRVHTGEQPFTCGICFKTFSQSSNLHRHLDTHSLIKNNDNSRKKKEYKCSICKQTFRQALHVTRHMTTHTGKTITCDTCGKTFVDKFGLERHLLIHSKVKPFKCDFCGKGFNRKETYRAHTLKFHSDLL